MSQDKQTTDENHRPLFFLSAGEPSGDIHAAQLVEELKKRFPTARFVAYGGPQMQKAGCETPVMLTELAVMWFGRVLWNLRTFLGYLRDAKKFFEREKPDMVILVDFPGLNWLLAKRAKAAGIPVCYFMPPQVWGWAQWRVKKMQRFVDFVLCTLPFEEKWLHKHGVEAINIGHPFFAEVREKKIDNGFVRSLDADTPSRPILLVLPGSRNQEITNNIRDLITALKEVTRRVPSVRPMVGAFKASQAETVRAALAAENLPLPVYVGHTAELMSVCSAALAVSGSVSMELLAHRVPTVIYYRISRLAYIVMRRFRRVKYITLVNLLSADFEGEISIFYDDHVKFIPKRPSDRERELMIFPEFLTDRDRGREAAEPLVEWLLDETKRLRQKERITETLRREDRRNNPAALAAEVIFERLTHVL